MRTWTTLRVTGALVVIPLCFALSAFISLNESQGLAYGVVDLAAVSFQVAYTGPLTAAFVAFSFGRHTRPLLDARPTRSGLWLLLNTWSWLLVGPPLASVVAMVMVTGVVPSTSSEWRIAGVTMLAGVACSALGAFASRALHPVLAVPLASLGSFAFLALPGTGMNLILVNINSDFAGCCGTDQQPATAMVLGSAAVTGVFVIGALATFIPSGWRRQPRWLVATCLLTSMAVSGAVGAAIVTRVGDPLTLLAVQARTDPVRCLERSELEACVWPENEKHLDQLLSGYAELRDRLEQGGLPTWKRVSEAPADAEADLVVVPQPWDLDDLTYIVAAAYSWHAPACGAGGGPPYSEVGTAWAGSLVGVSGHDLLESGVTRRSLQTARDQVARGPEGAAARFAEVVCSEAAKR